MKCKHSWVDVGSFTVPENPLEDPIVWRMKRHNVTQLWNANVETLRICVKCFEVQSRILGQEWNSFTKDKVLSYGPIQTDNFQLMILYSAIRDGVYIQEWPPTIEEIRDSRKRLHCEDGPALIWPGHMSGYYWHGTRIPSDWIQNRTKITTKEFLQERNAERRKALYEILGNDSVLRMLNAELVDDRNHPDEYPKLFEAHDPALQTSTFRMVQVKEPNTGDVYSHFVSIRCKTAKEAVASLWGKRIEEFRPENLKV